MIYLLSPNLSEKHKYQNLIHLPTIEIEFLEKEINISEYNLFIFTSKNGVIAFDKNLKNRSDWQKIEALAVGNKTADEVSKFGGTILRTPHREAYGENIFPQIEEIAKTKNLKIALIRPEKVVTDLDKIVTQSNLKNIKLDKFILYKTKCREFSKEFSDKPILIITAPSTYECLLNSKNKIPSNSIFVAIGKKSLNAIDLKYKRFTSESQTIESAILKAQEILKNITI